MAADICIYTNNSFVVEKVTIEDNGLLPATKKANVLSAPEEGDDDDGTKKRQ